MRHRRTTARLGKKTDHRKALLRNLATSLTLHGRVTTTTPKAKALLGYYEHLIALARRQGDHHVNAVRLLKRYLYTEASQKAFLERLKTLKQETGCIRSVKKGYRVGDRAELSIVEFTS